MIDYDVGDLVVCVDADGARSLRTGQCYTVAGFFNYGFPAVSADRRFQCRVGVFLAEVHEYVCVAPARLKKLPKKSQSFFAGEDQRVPA